MLAVVAVVLAVVAAVVAMGIEAYKLEAGTELPEY